MREGGVKLAKKQTVLHLCSQAQTLSHQQHSRRMANHCTPHLCLKHGNARAPAVLLDFGKRRCVCDAGAVCEARAKVNQRAERVVAFRANAISKIFIAVAKKLLFVKEAGEGVC